MNLLRAELMKLWTVRTPRVLLVVSAVVAFLVAAAQLLVIEFSDGDPTLSANQVAGMLSGAAVAIPLVTFIGAIGATSEIRHQTEYLNHLISPTRWPHAVARLGAYLLFGLLFAAVLLAALMAVVAAWALIRVGAVPWSATPTRILLGIPLVTTTYTAIGLAIGSIFRNQILAVSLLAGWIFFLEGIFVIALAIIDLRLTSLMPIQATQALLIDDALLGAGFDDAISFGVWPTVGIIVVWTVALSVIGMWRTLSSDIK